MPKKNSIILPCVHCGAPISRSEYWRKRNKFHFCSRSCKVEHIEPFEARIQRLTKPHGECLLWLGSRDKGGYGLTSIKGKTTRVARAIWTHFNGPIPDGLGILHSCDTPPCCALSHFFLGTAKDNAQDASRKGRTALGARNATNRYPELFRGERNGRAILGDSDILVIRARLQAGETRKSLASEYGVCVGSINFIAQGKTWRHLLTCK